MRLLLYVDLQRRLLVGGLNDPQAATLPELMQGDTVDVVLQSVEKNAETAVQYYRAIPTPFATIKCAITVGADVPPADGTIRLGLTSGGASDVTPPFPAGLTKRELETLLNALPGVVAKGGVRVLTTNQATNIYLLRWNNAAETAVFDFRENLLEPACETRSTLAPLPNGRIQAVKVRQRPLAFTDQFALPAAPVVTTAVVRTGTGTRNCIQAIGTPRGSVGQVHFNFASLATRILSVSGLTPAAVAGALNDLYADGQTRFAVTQPGATVLYVECVGPLALADQPLITAEMHDQAPVETPTARLPLDGPSLELAFDGGPKLALTLELEITDTDGEVGTPVHTPVTIRNDIIDAGMALNADPDWLLNLDPAYPPYDPANAAIVVPGAYLLSLGTGGGDTGETSDPTGRIHVVTHNLGTLDLIIELHETGNTRRRVPDEQYVLTKPNENQVQIEFPVTTFPAAPLAGQYRLSISAVKAAEMGLPHHTHPISDVIGLEDRLTEIEAGQEDPVHQNIPDNRLPAHIAWRMPAAADGTLGAYRFDPIPLDLLPANVALLNANGQLPATAMPPGVLQVGPGGAITVTTGTPPQTLTLFTVNTSVSPAALVLGDVFSTSITQIIQTALQAGAMPPAGLTPMQLPKVDLTFPEPVKLRESDLAPSALSLMPALVNPADAGNFSGPLPLPGPGFAGKRLLIQRSATADTTRWRPAQRFRDGQIVACNGQHWYPVTLAPNDALAWACEYDRELFRVPVSPRMLVPGARFSASFALQLALLGSTVTGQYLLRVVLGSRSAAPGGANVLAVTEQLALLEEPLLLTDALVTHPFAVAVARAADGSLTAERTLYGQTSPVVLPAGVTSDFVVTATLCRFDVDDSDPNPTGQIRIAMNGAVASVFKPSS